MKTLESIKQYSPCECESGGQLGNGTPLNERARKTAGGSVNGQAYSSDKITKSSITFYML